MIRLCWYLNYSKTCYALVFSFNSPESLDYLSLIQIYDLDFNL